MIYCISDAVTLICCMLSRSFLNHCILFVTIDQFCQTIFFNFLVSFQSNIHSHNVCI